MEIILCGQNTPTKNNKGIGQHTRLSHGAKKGLTNALLLWAMYSIPSSPLLLICNIYTDRDWSRSLLMSRKPRFPFFPKKNGNGFQALKKLSTTLTC